VGGRGVNREHLLLCLLPPCSKWRQPCIALLQEKERRQKSKKALDVLCIFIVLFHCFHVALALGKVGKLKAKEIWQIKFLVIQSTSLE